MKKPENMHLFHVEIKWRWKGVGVGEEMTKDYVIQVIAAQMGQGIMLNTVRECHF